MVLVEKTITYASNLHVSFKKYSDKNKFVTKNIILNGTFMSYFVLL